MNIHEVYAPPRYVPLRTSLYCSVLENLDFSDTFTDWIILSQQSYKKLHGRVGTMTLTNTANGLSKVIKKIFHSETFTCSVDDALPYSFLDHKEEQTGVHHVILGADIRQDLQLKAGDEVVLEKAVNFADQIVLSSLADKKNSFGKSQNKYSYSATAIFNGIREDKTPGVPAIFLNGSQILYLAINRRLRPLCGENRYLAALERNKDVVGVVQLFHQDTIYHVDVFVDADSDERGSTIHISKTLLTMLGPLIPGDVLFLCSRFDTTTGIEARESHLSPRLESQEPYDVIDLLSKLNIYSPCGKVALHDYVLEKRKTNFSHEFIPQVKLAHFLVSLAAHALQLAADPRLLIWLFGFFEELQLGYPLMEVEEFKKFLFALKTHEHIFIFYQIEYMQLISKKMDCYVLTNPLVYYAFFFMEIDVKDINGGNLLHLMFDGCGGSLQALDEAFGPLLNSSFFWKLIQQTNSNNLTPLDIIYSESKNWHVLINL